MIKAWVISIATTAKKLTRSPTAAIHPMSQQSSCVTHTIQPNTNQLNKQTNKTTTIPTQRTQTRSVKCFFGLQAARVRAGPFAFQSAETVPIFLVKAALIITIVAVIKLCCNLSLLDNGSERKVRDNRTQNKTKQKKKHKQTKTPTRVPDRSW